MQDDRALKEVEIKIRSDGKVVWINSPSGCIMRICGIENLYLEDERPAKKQIDILPPECDYHPTDYCINPERGIPSVILDTARHKCRDVRKAGECPLGYKYPFEPPVEEPEEPEEPREGTTCPNCNFYHHSGCHPLNCHNCGALMEVE